MRDKNENSYDGNNKSNDVSKPSNKPNKGKQNQGNSLGPKKDQGNSRSLKRRLFCLWKTWSFC